MCLLNCIPAELGPLDIEVGEVLYLGVALVEQLRQPPLHLPHLPPQRLVVLAVGPFIKDVHLMFGIFDPLTEL